MVHQLQEVYQFSSPMGNYIQTYLEELQSEDTRTAYQSDFARFLQERFGKTMQTITKSEIETIDYDTIIEYRKSLPLANSTINRHVNSIKSILLYLKSRKLITIDTDFFSVIKELPKQTKEIPHMPIEVAQEYIKEAKNETHNGSIKSNLLMFAVDSGLRLSEIVNLKLSNFQKDEDSYLLTGFGKGNKQYKDRIANEVYEELMKTYVPNEEERVFYPLSEKNIKDMMLRLRKKLNYENEKYSFHSLRKTAITFAHDSSGSLLVAQRKANHSSPNTTTIYIENRELPVTGYFSTQNQNKNKYKEVSHEDLLSALEQMPEEFLQILNNKLSN